MHSTIKQATAYHEAGHAFADHKLGFTIKNVTILPEGEALGTASVKGLQLWRVELSGGRMTCKELGRYHDLIVSILAGAEAQRRFRPPSARAYRDSSDWRAANDLLSDLHGDREKECFYAFRYLQTRARYLVATRKIGAESKTSPKRCSNVRPSRARR